MVYSIIKKSQLEGAKRLDAEYYQPEYLEIKEKLALSPTLAEISEKITDFGAYSQMNFVEYEDKGIRFFRNQDIGEFFINESDPIFISADIYKRLTLKLEEYDIITPRVGTLGNAAVIFKNHLPASANQNLAQIKPNRSKIDPLYLAVFLSSRLGRQQFERYATGNMQPWLNLEQIKSLRVFVPAVEMQKEIRSIAERVIEQFNGSKSFYSQSQNWLLEELKINILNLNDQLNYVVNLSDSEEQKRWDADYFQPKYRILLEHLKNNFKAMPLGELVNIKKGVEPGVEDYQEEGKPFIRVSNMSKYGINDNNQKYLSEDLYNKLKKDYEPRKGEILLTKDASPGIAYLVKQDTEGIISGGILRLKLKDNSIDSEYLTLCLNSIVGQMQAERDAGGSVIKHWKPEQIKNVIIPILSREIQDKISDLIYQSFDVRARAEHLLEEAKRKVENLIEEGGDKNGQGKN